MSTNDAPIASPAEDRFGADAFAKALALGITRMASPEGVVIAVNGAWGSGKSSTLNLIVHHLAKLSNGKAIEILRFCPWWHSGAGAITAAYFGELQIGLGKTLGKDAAAALQAVAKRIMPGSSGSVESAPAPGRSKAGAAADAPPAASAGAEEALEAQHAKIARAMAKSKKRFLIVIDDVDRLNPEESAQVFKLLKSVGRLPNVIYLLAYDRALTEKVIAERYPSEGSHYLEKIVQVTFEVPLPSAEDLREAFLTDADQVCQPGALEDNVRYMNVILGVVMPLLNTPRDVKRLIGMLHVTWPAVVGEVDRADFIAMEALRLFRPALYRAIRVNGKLVAGSADPATENPDQAARYDEALLKSVGEAERETFRAGLMRLFPKLHAVWANTSYGHEWSARWRRQRLVCSPEHFSTYFRFAVGDAALQSSEIAELIGKAGNRKFVQATMRDAATQRLRSGRTRASLILDELAIRAEDIAADQIGAFLGALFEIADEIDTPEDDGRGLSVGNNGLRLHWLINALVRDRLEMAQRTAVIVEALQSAPLHWFCDFAVRCQREHQGSAADPSDPAARPLVDAATSVQLIEMARERIRTAAGQGSLVAHPKLVPLLFEWARLFPAGLDEVRAVTAGLLDRREFILNIAKHAIGLAWSQSLGLSGADGVDAPNRSAPEILRDEVDRVVDRDKFIAQVEAFAAAAEPGEPEIARTLTEFLELWNSPAEPEAEPAPPEPLAGDPPAAAEPGDVPGWNTEAEQNSTGPDENQPLARWVWQ